MKKIIKIVVAFICIILITYGCMIVYDHFTKETVQTHENEKTTDVKTDSAKISDKISNEPIFTLDNYPKVDASLATQPLANAFIENFTGEHNISEEYLDYTNTHPGYIRLVDGDVDLIVVTEPSEEELAYAQEKNVELEVIPVVKEGFVFYVNHQNPVTNLSLEQIQDIYSGKITNWSEVGGSDEEIKAFQRPVNSGSQTGMLSLVMKDKELMESPKENVINGMEEIINIVSSYDNGINSIGYSYYYYATTMFETIDSSVRNRIKLLAINGVEPNNTTIKNEEYPLETSYYIVIRKDEPQDSNVRKLVEAMLSERGQAIAEEVGYVGVK